MKVYVVTRSYYDEFELHAVYATRELAEQRCQQETCRLVPNSFGRCAEWEIEEREVRDKVSDDGALDDESDDD